MYLLLVPPIAVAIALLVIAVSRLAGARSGRFSRIDEAEAHRRCLEALDPRAPVRKAAREAAQESPQATARIRRPA